MVIITGSRKTHLFFFSVRLFQLIGFKLHMSLAKELGMCGKGEISSGRVKPLSKHLDTAVKCRTEEGLLGAHSSSGLWLVLLRWEHSAAAGQCCESWLCLMEVCCSLGAAVCMCCVSMEFWAQVGMMCLLVQDEKPLFPHTQ